MEGLGIWKAPLARNESYPLTPGLESSTLFPSSKLQTIMWILTSEHNAYDQFGAYFLGAWDTKPEVDSLLSIEDLSGIRWSEISELQKTGQLERNYGGGTSYNLFEHIPSDQK